MFCNNINEVKQGDIYLYKFIGEDSEQIGLRPALVIQNNKGNFYSNKVIIAPLTSHLKREDISTHIVLPAKETGLKYDSMVELENPITISKNKLQKKIAYAPEKYMKRIAAAWVLSTSIISTLNIKDLVTLYKKFI